MASLTRRFLVRTMTRPMIPARAMAGNMEKRAGDLEAKWINQHEADVLKNLVQKLNAANDPDGSKARVHLADVFKKHKITPTAELEQDLRAWKAAH